MRFIISLFICFLINNQSLAQLGCTDPQAQNYDADAIENDGSCTYDLTEYTLTELVQLPDLLKECSGLELMDSGLWIHNDGGNEDKIYLIDSLDGTILEAVILATADNIDWEDIAENEDYIYVGDFGNNPGNRMDLTIHRINKSDLASGIVNTEFIEFSYSDQVDFTVNENNHNFDCEAFLFHNDSLHLFTKNWDDNQTKHYVLPAVPGNHTAELVESFNVGGLITGADISENNEIVLIGYTEFGVNFMWLLFDFQESFFFSGNKRRIALGTGLTNSQTEGITFRGNGYGYICSEQFKVNNQITLPQKLLSFSIKQWVDNTTNLSLLDDTYQLTAFPNPTENRVQLKWSKPIDSWKLLRADGRLLQEKYFSGYILEDEIITEHLRSGSYFLEIKKDGKIKTIQLLKL